MCSCWCSLSLWVASFPCKFSPPVFVYSDCAFWSCSYNSLCSLIVPVRYLCVSSSQVGPYIFLETFRFHTFEWIYNHIYRGPSSKNTCILSIDDTSFDVLLHVIIAAVITSRYFKHLTFSKLKSPNDTFCPILSFIGWRCSRFLSPISSSFVQSQKTCSVTAIVAGDSPCRLPCCL